MTKAERLLKETKEDPFGFFKALSPISGDQFRIHAEMPDGKVGITPWYSEASLPALKKEIIQAGHKIIKIEKRRE